MRRGCGGVRKTPRGQPGRGSSDLPGLPADLTPTLACLQAPGTPNRVTPRLTRALSAFAPAWQSTSSPRRRISGSWPSLAWEKFPPPAPGLTYVAMGRFVGWKVRFIETEDGKA